MEAQIANLVQESLSLYLYDNACFLAERLVAEYPNEVRCVRLHAIENHRIRDGCGAPVQSIINALPPG